MGVVNVTSRYGWSREAKERKAAEFIPLTRLRRMRGSEQVAAVCYRVRDRETEFLLVRTRGGRWIFPKGSAEAGLTHAQAAALEAFEEAGVHGRMEESAFARYVRRSSRANRSGQAELVVHAHLCEVTWLESPLEMEREPTWFPLQKAKKRLREKRGRDFGNDLARVLDCAVERIQRIHRGPTVIDARGNIVFIDELQHVAKRIRRLR